MYELGGAQVHVRDLSEELVLKEHSVTILYGGKNYIDEALFSDKVDYIYCKSLTRNINPWMDLHAICEIRKKVKELNPDIVAIHSSKAGIVGRIATWSLRIPFVFTAHGWAFANGVGRKKQTIYRYLEKIIGQISSRIITVSDQDRELALSLKVLSPEKITTIHNGVVDNYHVQRLDRRTPITITMVARFERPKKQLELIKALVPLKQHDWQLVFIGEGSLKQEAVMYVHEQLLDKKVSFLEASSNVSQLLTDTDIFVLTSSWEGLPLSILEAMSHELPIIASDVGGVKEAVHHTLNGFLIQDNLTELLHLLINDHELRIQMGKNSRKLYEKSFSFEKMYDKTISLYKELIS